MANTYTVSEKTVMGTWRVETGVLTMTDSATGSSANTGFDRIFAALDQSDVQAKISHTGGDIIACTAASAAVYNVIIFGV